MIDLFQPQLGGKELAALAETMDSKWIGHGPRTLAFEAEFAEHASAHLPAATGHRVCLGLTRQLPLGAASARLSRS
jgi:dTDP-4-amino-4,6-dideoxygalactose transaminase